MKKLMISALLGTVLCTTATATVSFAAENGKGNVKNQPVIEIEKEFNMQDSDFDFDFDFDFENGKDCEIYEVEYESFQDFMKGMEDVSKKDNKEINKKDLNKLEKLYNEATKLEKNNKFDDSFKKWDEFHNILNKYYEDEMEISIDMSDDILPTSTDYIDIEELMNSKNFEGIIEIK